MHTAVISFSILSDQSEAQGYYGVGARDNRVANAPIVRQMNPRHIPQLCGLRLARPDKVNHQPNRVCGLDSHFVESPPRLPFEMSET